MNKIKDYRAKKKMSQEELAKRAQISRPHLSNIENDEAQPTIDVAIRIAEALGQKVDNIFLSRMLCKNNKGGRYGKF